MKKYLGKKLKPPYDGEQFTTIENPYKESIKSITVRELDKMLSRIARCNNVQQLEDLEQALRVALASAIANAQRPETIQKLNWPGLLVWERTKCGKKGCRCALGGHHRHGPYFYVFTDRGPQSDRIPKGRAG